jgi:hypothetical protein
MISGVLQITEISRESSNQLLNVPFCTSTWKNVNIKNVTYLSQSVYGELIEILGKSVVNCDKSSKLNLKQKIVHYCIFYNGCNKC